MWFRTIQVSERLAIFGESFYKTVVPIVQRVQEICWVSAVGVLYPSAGIGLTS
jgi:hypothetical protein